MTELALALIATLALAEVIARWFGWRKDRSTWGRFAVGPVSVFVAVAVLTVVGIALFEGLVLETSQTRVSLIAAGIQLFGAGWVIRYWTIVPVALHRKPILRKGFHWLQELHWRGFLCARHPRYAGLWLEVVGFASIIGGPIALVASCGLAAILTLAARLEEELIELRGPQYAERIAVARQFNPNTIWRPSLAVALLILPVAAITLGVAFAVDDIHLFESDYTTAQTLMLSIAGAQGTLLLFVISSLLIGLQLTASSYSWRATQHLLLRYRLVAAIGLVVASIVFDVVVVARTDDWLKDPEMAPRLVDEALLLAAVSIPILFWSITSLLPLFTAESLIESMLRRLGEGWKNWVVQDWTEDRYSAPPNDPFLPISDVIRGVLHTGDVAGFRACISRLARRTEELWPRAESPLSVSGSMATPGQLGEAAKNQWPDGDHLASVAAMDGYLHWHFRSLIRSAANAHDPDFIEGFYELFHLLYQSGHPYPPPLERILWPLDESPGEKLMREVVRAGLLGKKYGTARDALSAVAFAGERLIPALPGIEELSGLLNRDYDYSKERSQGEKELERTSDAKMTIIQSAYIGYISDIGVQAAGEAATEVVEGALINLDGFARIAVRSEYSNPIRLRVIQSALWSVYAIIDKAVARRLSVHPWLGGSTLAMYIDEIKDGSDVIAVFGAYGAAVLRRLRLGDMLSYGGIDEVATLGAIISRKEPTAVRSIVEELVEVYRSGTGGHSDETKSIRTQAYEGLKRIKPFVKEVSEVDDLIRPHVAE